MELRHQDTLGGKPYFEALDLVRGMAAITVVISHARNLLMCDFADVPNKSIFAKLFYFATNFGHQAVIYFFVLSGLVIGNSVLGSHRKSSFIWSEYLISRITRLWVVLVPALLLTALLDWTGREGLGSWIYRTPSFGHVLPVDILGNFNFGTGIGNLFFCQTILVPVFGTNGPLWSLANEFWYYLLFPVLLGVSLAKQPVALRVFQLGIFCLGLWFVKVDIAAYFLIWLLGCGAILVYGSERIRLPREHLAYALAAALALNIAVLVLCRTNFFRYDYVSDVALGIAASFLFYALLHLSAGKIPGILLQIGSWTAQSSFTLYAFHMPFLVLLVALILGSRERIVFGPLSISLVVLIVLGTIGLGRLLYQLFEAHTGRIRKALLKRFKVE